MQIKGQIAKAMSMQVCNTCQPAQIPNNSAMRDQTLRHVAARLQGKLTEAFDSLRHALAIYDGHPFDCTIALTETHYLREPTYTLEAAAHSAVPPGVPPDVLLNIRTSRHYMEAITSAQDAVAKHVSDCLTTI